jgi:hypothetical protein
MNGHVLDGREIKVEIASGVPHERGAQAHTLPQSKPGDPSKNLFVANIPAEVQDTDLLFHFGKFGKGFLLFISFATPLPWFSLLFWFARLRLCMTAGIATSLVGQVAAAKSRLQHTCGFCGFRRRQGCTGRA